MKRKIISQILFGCLAIGLTASCTSITKLFPKDPRPFQKKKFSPEEWKSGDYQTRGEMAEDLRAVISDPKAEWKKSSEEVRQILGKPDVVTEADCCEAGRGHGPEKVELWLYYLEIEDDYDVPQKTGEAERALTPKAFKLYFRKGSSRQFETLIGDRTGNHSRVMTVVGYLHGNSNLLIIRR